MGIPADTFGSSVRPKLEGGDLIFSPPWARNFVQHWNSYQHHHLFANAGPAQFTCIDGKEHRSMCVFWDQAGQACETSGSSHLPHFRGNIQVWHDVVFANLSPFGAVLQGRISYSGSPRFPLSFGRRFEHIANVARGFTMQKGISR